MLPVLVACFLLFTVGGLAAQTSAPKPQSNVDASADDLPAFQKLEPTLQFFRSRSAHEYAIDSTRGIEEASFIPIGGIDQWVTIRGYDRRNPVLLFLHGGPGEATNLWSFPFFAEWEKHFTVVQWDQRGAGKTFGRSGPSIAPTMTLDRMTQDGIDLAEYLRAHLGQHKIILVGHSFGTILGLRMIRQRPDLFLAYVGTGQVADETRNYAVAYNALLEKARALHNQQAIHELEAAGPPPYSSSAGFQVQRRWSNRFEGADRFLPATLGLAFEAPGYNVQDLVDLLAGELFSGDHLIAQARSATMTDLGLHFAVPVFFFEGTEDFTTPTELARSYLTALQAPQKEFVPISGGHFAVFIHSDEFLRQLLAHISPLAAKDSLASIRPN